MKSKQDWHNSKLTDYLLYDTWEPYKALGVLAGYDYGAFNDSHKLKNPLLAFLDPAYVTKNELINIDVGDTFIKYEKAGDNERKLRDFWLSGHSSDERQSPSYFIDWAVSKRFRPDWLDWAIENKLYVPADTNIAAIEQSLINNKPLSTRTHNNYLRLIMALANGLVGFNPQNPYSAAQLIIDETGIDISQDTLAGYISKAYELESKKRE